VTMHARRRDNGRRHCMRLQPLFDRARLGRHRLGDQREDVGVAIGPRRIEARQLGARLTDALVAVRAAPVMCT